MKDKDEWCCCSSVFLVWWSRIIALWRNKITKFKWIYCVFLTVQKVTIVWVVAISLFIDASTPLPFRLSLTSLLSCLLLTVSCFPLPSLCFPFSAPSSKVLRSSIWTTSKFEACGSSHFPGHTPHLPHYLTWLLQRIPGTFLGLTGKKWFAKCHFFLFLFFQQHAAWFRTKVDSFFLNQVHLVCLMFSVFPWVRALLDEHTISHAQKLCGTF